MPDGRTVARPITETQTGPTPKSRGAGKRSPQRVLSDRLSLGQYKPRAWAVALALDAYSRADHEGRRFSTVYHAKLASITGLSIKNVRRALRELTSGEAPLYEKRGTSGRLRKVRARNGWELDTRGVAYYWIETLEAYLAARDTARGVNVLAFEERKAEHHGERVMLQAAMLTGEIDQDTYAAKVAQLDAKARGRLPKTATTRKPSRCLTVKQLEWFADVLVRGGTEGQTRLRELVGDDGKQVRQFHALYGHVFGTNGAGCQTCEVALFEQTARHRIITSWLTNHRMEAARCGCGVLVIRGQTVEAYEYWTAIATENPTLHECIHEQNRLMKLRNGGHP